VSRQVHAGRLQRPVRQSRGSASAPGVGIGIAIGIDSRHALGGRFLMDRIGTTDIGCSWKKLMQCPSIPNSDPDPDPD
jgi:hypothetical protein